MQQEAAPSRTLSQIQTASDVLKLAFVVGTALGEVGVMAQTPSGGTSLDWPTILAAYGVAAPLVIYLIRDASRKDSSIERLEARNKELTDATIDKIVPLTTQGIEILRETAAEMKALVGERERLIEMMRGFSTSRELDPTARAEIQRMLRDLQQRLDSEGKT